MKKLVLVLLALVMCLSCAFAEDDKNFVLTFTSNPTTGYDWEYAVMDEEVVSVESEFYTGEELIKYLGEEVPADYEMSTGEGGLQVFTVKGLKPGSTVIALEYKQNWDDESTVVGLTYSLKVLEDLTVIAVAGTAGV